MRMVRPRLDTETITVAENQEEYLPVTAALTRHPSYPPARGLPYNTIVTAWKPTPYELELLNKGEPLHICLLTMLEPMQPLIAVVGTNEVAGIYGVGVEK
jgi:hypothetical protein